MSLTLTITLTVRGKNRVGTELNCIEYKKTECIELSKSNTICMEGSDERGSSHERIPNTARRKIGWKHNIWQTPRIDKWDLSVQDFVRNMNKVRIGRKKIPRDFAKLIENPGSLLCWTNA